LQKKLSLKSNEKDVGKVFEVLVEGHSKKSDDELSGRTRQNKMVVFPKMDYKKGDLVKVKIDKFTQTTLIGTPVE
jgi:tRNA-2-methylthio-N6-dimethylallyladenosine synthase